jgi:hypothetical protein
VPKAARVLLRTNAAPSRSWVQAGRTTPAAASLRYRQGREFFAPRPPVTWRFRNSSNPPPTSQSWPMSKFRVGVVLFHSQNWPLSRRLASTGLSCRARSALRCFLTRPALAFHRHERTWHEYFPSLPQAISSQLYSASGFLDQAVDHLSANLSADAGMPPRETGCPLCRPLDIQRRSRRAASLPRPCWRSPSSP